MSNNFNCRVCKSKNVKKFKFNHFKFKFKSNFKSYYCFDCGSVSEFNTVKNISYSDGSYRLRFNEKLSKKNYL